MEISQIHKIVQSAFQAGRIDAQIDSGLRSNLVRKKEAEAMVAIRGFKKNILEKWVQNGLLKEYVGDSINSPKQYSVKELQEIMMSVIIKQNI